MNCKKSETVAVTLKKGTSTISSWVDSRAHLHVGDVGIEDSASELMKLVLFVGNLYTPPVSNYACASWLNFLSAFCGEWRDLGWLRLSLFRHLKFLVFLFNYLLVHDLPFLFNESSFKSYTFSYTFPLVAYLLSECNSENIDRVYRFSFDRFTYIIL